jgi:hypothetical protein
MTSKFQLEILKLFAETNMPNFLECDGEQISFCGNISCNGCAVNQETNCAKLNNREGLPVVSKYVALKFRETHPEYFL